MQKFQSDNGLSSSGKIDALSLEKLGLGSGTAGETPPNPSLRPQLSHTHHPQPRPHRRNYHRLPQRRARPQTPALITTSYAAVTRTPLHAKPSRLASPRKLCNFEQTRASPPVTVYCEFPGAPNGIHQPRRLPKRAKSKSRVFDVKRFLDSTGLGRKVGKFAKKETVFAQGDPADVIYIQKGRRETFNRQ